MQIIVTADTHSRPLPLQMVQDMKKADMIIHAGDFCDFHDYEMLARVKEVKGVYGNMDAADVRKALPRKQVFDCEGVRMGLFHGEGHPKTILETVQREFKGEKLDVIIFGHSHQPFNEKIGPVLYFNPGSPNDTVFAPYCSYGRLLVIDGKVTADIIKVKKDG